MSNLDQIAERHSRDRWKDLLFIAAAGLLTALVLGATTSKGVGKPTEHAWSLTVVDPETQIPLR